MREKHNVMLCTGRNQASFAFATAKVTFLINKTEILKLVNEANTIIAHLQVKRVQVCN